MVTDAQMSRLVGTGDWCDFYNLPVGQPGVWELSTAGAVGKPRSHSFGMRAGPLALGQEGSRLSMMSSSRTSPSPP